MNKNNRYLYYDGDNPDSFGNRDNIAGALVLGQERHRPKLSNPDYLVLRQRKRLFAAWLDRLPGNALRVLDLGGRIQPYRALLGPRAQSYIAVDPQLNGLVDVVAVGEQLPFTENRFDLCICSQVLGYTSDPARVVEEIRRVLKPGGVVLLSAPAQFPCHHDERWRFLPEGYRCLFARFSKVEISPEGYSIAGIFRTLNVMLNGCIQNRFLRALAAALLFPLVNELGVMLDRLSAGNERMTANYSVCGRK